MTRAEPLPPQTNNEATAANDGEQLAPPVQSLRDSVTIAVQHYLKQLWRRYPSERVEQMLETLGIQMAREREAYFSDDEYAAAIMGTTPEALDEMFGDCDSEQNDGSDQNGDSE